MIETPFPTEQVKHVIKEIEIGRSAVGSLQ